MRRSARGGIFGQRADHCRGIEPAPEPRVVRLGVRCDRSCLLNLMRSTVAPVALVVGFRVSREKRTRTTQTTGLRPPRGYARREYGVPFELELARSHTSTRDSKH